MNPNKIQRGVQSRNSRSVGEAPLIGRVGRMRNDEAPGVRRRVRRNGIAGRPPKTKVNRTSMILWSVLLFIVTCGVIGTSLFLWVRSQRAAANTVAVGRMLENVRVASKFASPSEDQALSIVRRALDVKTSSEVEPLFRPGDSRPEEIVEFVKRLHTDGGKTERFEWLSSMDVDGLLMEGVVVVTERKGVQSEWLAILVPDDKGVWKVDFEALARTNRPALRDVLEGTVDRSRVRLFVAADSYYNGPFHDEAAWSCYAMFSPETRELLTDESELLRGYCKIGSPQDKAMKQIFADGARVRRVIVEIQRVEGAEKRQFQITRVLGEEWVMPPKPFDERID